MFVLDKSSYDSSDFITLLFGDLVCYYILSFALLVLLPPLPRLQDGPLVHGFSLVKACKVFDSLVGQTLHLLFIFILIFSLSSIVQRVSCRIQSLLVFLLWWPGFFLLLSITVLQLVSMWCPQWFLHVKVFTVKPYPRWRWSSNTWISKF